MQAKSSTTTVSSTQIIPRDQHTISRKQISENALKVIYRLDKAGYEAYLVGGCIRDLLLGRQPKDFDVTTNATPEQIRRLFRNCRLVGKRFRLAHIMFGREVIEVATFRAGHQGENADSPFAQQAKNGMLLRDNIYGSLQEDALRRDFSINALYYSPVDFAVRDYSDGWQDLQQGIIRLIGDPQTRYREDPVRMLRALRFSAKLGMQIEAKTAAPISQLAHLLREIPAARLFEEALKLLQTGHGVASLQLLRQYQLSSVLLPIVHRHFTAEGNSQLEILLNKVLANTDRRIQQDLRVNPAFLFAAILWYPLIELTDKLRLEGGLPYFDAFALASNDILAEQCRVLAIPKRLTLMMRDIWQLQLRLEKRFGKRAFMLLQQPKFRAAYDLLLLRADVENHGQQRNPALAALAQWWTDFQAVDEQQQQQMVAKIAQPARHKGPKNRRPKKNGPKKAVHYDSV